MVEPEQRQGPEDSRRRQPGSHPAPSGRYHASTGRPELTAAGGRDNRKAPPRDRRRLRRVSPAAGRAAVPAAAGLPPDRKLPELSIRLPSRKPNRSRERVSSAHWCLRGAGQGAPLLARTGAIFAASPAAARGFVERHHLSPFSLFPIFPLAENKCIHLPLSIFLNDDLGQGRRVPVV